MTPQAKQVQAHLKRHGTITPVHAFKHMGIYGLSQRIAECRQSGMEIVNKKWRTARGKVRSNYTYDREAVR